MPQAGVVEMRAKITLCIIGLLMVLISGCAPSPTVTKITGLTAPDKYIVGTLLCGYVSGGDNRGGGGEFGKKGAIPGLVQ